jgi:hypothetical protein
VPREKTHHETPAFAALAESAVIRPDSTRWPRSCVTASNRRALPCARRHAYWRNNELCSNYRSERREQSGRRSSDLHNQTASSESSRAHYPSGKLSSEVEMDPRASPVSRQGRTRSTSWTQPSYDLCTLIRPA